MKIPLRGSPYHGRVWKTESYSDRKYDVVIINGPCRFELGKRISLWSGLSVLHGQLLKVIDANTVVIVLGTRLANYQNESLLLKEVYHVIEEYQDGQDLGFLVLRK